MNPHEPGATLLEALQGLESTARELRLATQQHYEPQLESLQHVVALLA
jgi:hypothetical protein